MGGHPAALGQGLVGRQHADGVLGGLEGEHRFAGGGVGGRVHPGGNPQAVVVVQGRLRGAQHLLGPRHRHFRGHPVPAGVHQETVGAAVGQLADGAAFGLGQALEQGASMPARWSMKSLAQAVW